MDSNKGGAISGSMVPGSTPDPASKSGGLAAALTPGRGINDIHIGDFTTPSGGPFASMDSSLSGGSSHGIDLDANGTPSEVDESSPPVQRATYDTEGVRVDTLSNASERGPVESLESQGKPVSERPGVPARRRLRRQDESPLILSPSLSSNHPLSPFAQRNRARPGAAESRASSMDGSHQIAAGAVDPPAAGSSLAVQNKPRHE